FGSLNVHPYVATQGGDPELLEVVKEKKDKRNFGGVWHADLSFLPEPPLGSILYAKEVPPFGGDTLWSSLYLAYEALSPGMKQMLDEVVAIHSATSVYGPAELTGANRS